MNQVYFDPREIQRYKLLQQQDPFQSLLSQRDESKSKNTTIDIMKCFGRNQNSSQEESSKKVKKRMVLQTKEADAEFERQMREEFSRQEALTQAEQ